MLLTGALIIILTKTNPAPSPKNEVFRSGMNALEAGSGNAGVGDRVAGAAKAGTRGRWGGRGKWQGVGPAMCGAGVYDVERLGV
nr:hypothetical protein [Escherichia coli]